MKLNILRRPYQSNFSPEILQVLKILIIPKTVGIFSIGTFSSQFFIEKITSPQKNGIYTPRNSRCMMALWIPDWNLHWCPPQCAKKYKSAKYIRHPMFSSFKFTLEIWQYPPIVTNLNSIFALVFPLYSQSCCPVGSYLLWRVSHAA